MNNKNEQESPKWYFVGAVVFAIAAAVWGYSTYLSGRQNDMIYTAVALGTCGYCAWKAWDLKKKEKK